jgi:hypothetical protein
MTCRKSVMRAAHNHSGKVPEQIDWRKMAIVQDSGTMRQQRTASPEKSPAFPVNDFPCVRLARSTSFASVHQ